MIEWTQRCPSHGAMLVDQSAQLFTGDINHVARANFLSMIPALLEFIVEKPLVPAKLSEANPPTPHPRSTALNMIMVREKDTFGFVIAFTDSNMANEIVFAFSLLHRL